jgi:hypothetical protein
VLEHDGLVAKVRRSEANLFLVTIDYDGRKWRLYPDSRLLAQRTVERTILQMGPVR